MESEKLVLSVQETATCLGLSRNLIYALLREKKIPSIRFGKRILIPKIALLRMMEGGGDEQH